MTRTARPQPTDFGALEGGLCFLIAALLATASGLRRSTAVLHGALENPDTYMRLNRLHDILARHTPLHIVLRDASGDGAVMSWSHLLDSLLLLLALPLRPFIGQGMALHGAAVLLGPLEVGLLGAAASWAAATLADRRWRWTAAVLAGLAPPIVSYGLPGVAHHHVLVAMVAVMLAGHAGRAARGAAISGWLAGVWAAAGIWLTPEIMPFVLLAFGAIGLAWLLRPAGKGIGNALAAGGGAFLMLTAAAFAVDPPMPGYGSVEIDRLSIVYVVLAAVICAAGWAMRALGRSRLGTRARRSAGLALAVTGVAAWAAMFPAVLRGPDGLMDAASARAFFGIIQEMAPIGSGAEVLELLIDGTLAGVVLAWFALTRRSWEWGYAALCVGAMVLLGWLHTRFATYASAAAAVLLPLALTETTRLLARYPAALPALARVGLLALMLASTRASAAFVPGAAASSMPDKACPVGGLAAMLAPYGGQVVLTDVDDAPELLYRTEILTVGSLYHRNIAGFLRLRAAWRAMPSATVPDAVRATRATLVLACPGAARPAMVGDLPPRTLFDSLARGEAPPWLVEAARDAGSGNVLYRVADPTR